MDRTKRVDREHFKGERNLKFHRLACKVKGRAVTRKAMLWGHGRAAAGKVRRRSRSSIQIIKLVYIHLMGGAEWTKESILASSQKCKR